MSHHDLKLPDLGLGDLPIKLSVWLVERGAQVKEGEPVVEVLAGEAVVDLPAPASGVLIKRFVAEDQPVAVGQRLGLIEAGEWGKE